jgi:hypothetical protein
MKVLILTLALGMLAASGSVPVGEFLGAPCGNGVDIKCCKALGWPSPLCSWLFPPI